MQHSLFFLMRLLHAELPFRVDRSEEIKFVSVLKATGLIEAEIVPAFEPTSAFAPAQIASVIRITEEGMAELDNWLSGQHEHRA